MAGVRGLYTHRVAKECPSCDGESELKKDDGDVYVTCTCCDESTERVSFAHHHEAYQRAIAEWNRAVAEQRDERHWRMTGLEYHRERQGASQDEHVAGAGKESESVR